MSDEHMILTIERMQIELRRAMEDIQILTSELQKRMTISLSPVVPVAPVVHVAPVVPVAPVIPVAPVVHVSPVAEVTSVAEVTAVAEMTPIEGLKKSRKVIKIKLKKQPPLEVIEPKKKITGLAPWNAYVSMVRMMMKNDSETEKVDEKDIRLKAKSMKDNDPEGYKTFCTEWLSIHADN